MRTVDYQVVVQWSKRSLRYEAYSPTLCDFAAKFVPEFPRTAYGDTLAEAAENYTAQATKLLDTIRRLAILPPPSDIGPTDPLDYGGNTTKLGKMVL